MLSCKATITSFFFASLLLFVVAAPAQADITELQKLRFGTWSITNNNSPHSITVAPNGSYNKSSSALIMISPPQPGLYRVTGLPPFTAVGSVNITMNQPMQSGVGPNFILENFTTAIPNTDAAGDTTLTLGATAKTSGTSQGYGDDTYAGELHIEINL